MQRVLSNKNNKLVGEELKRAIKPKSRLSVLSALFTIFAFDELKTSFGKLDSAWISRQFADWI